MKEPYNHSNLSAMDFQKIQIPEDFSAIQLVNTLVHIFPHLTFLEVQQNIFCHICARCHLSGTHFPKTFAAAVTPGQQQDQLIYSKLGRFGRFGRWAEAILLENFREKKPQHKMKVGWFRGSSSRFQNSKIMVISAEDSPTYGSPYPFGWLDHNVGHFTQPPNDCFADIAQQLSRGFV